jgi:magnesium transporter
MIVNCLAYAPNRPPRPVTMDGISDALCDKETFVWLGIADPSDEELRKVQEEFGLHELAIEDALTANQRPKIESYGNSMFIALRTMQLIDDEIAEGEVHLFVSPQCVITIRHGNVRSFAPVRQRAESSAKHLLDKGAAYVLYAILDFIVDQYSEVATVLEARFDALEREIFTDQFDNRAIAKLYDIKSRMVDLRGAAMPVEGICSELVRLHEEFVSKELRAYFRDIQDHIARVVDTVDVVREMLTTAIQVNLALVQVSQNEIVKRLAGWGAVLAVPTIVFSLYGMNFKSMPELDWTLGYPVTLCGTVLGCAIMYWRFRRAGWL